MADDVVGGSGSGGGCAFESGTSGRPFMSASTLRHRAGKRRAVTGRPLGLGVRRGHDRQPPARLQTDSRLLPCHAVFVVVAARADLTEQKQALIVAAERDGLELSTWARQVPLRAAESCWARKLADFRQKSATERAAGRCRPDRSDR